jgi:hypothetical protein
MQGWQGRSRGADQRPRLPRGRSFLAPRAPGGPPPLPSLLAKCKWSSSVVTRPLASFSPGRSVWARTAWTGLRPAGAEPGGRGGQKLGRDVAGPTCKCGPNAERGGLGRGLGPPPAIFAPAQPRSANAPAMPRLPAAAGLGRKVGREEVGACSVEVARQVRRGGRGRGTPAPLRSRNRPAPRTSRASAQACKQTPMCDSSVTGESAGRVSKSERASVCVCVCVCVGGLGAGWGTGRRRRAGRRPRLRTRAQTPAKPHEKRARHARRHAAGMEHRS